jgi:RHS repeat-associated protein
LPVPGFLVTQTVIYPDSTNAATQVTINGQLTSSTSKTGIQTDYTCDALGRQIASLNPEPRTLGSFTTYNSLGQVASTMDAASNRTSFVFDDLGRRIQVTDPLTNSTFTAYDPEARVLATWGATYPVAYDYDDFGRMTAMYTLRDSSLVISNYSSFITHTSSFDRTCWLYDLATGLLTNKLYSDNKGPAYTYTADGKLATRTWARGVVTAYSYDSLGQLTNISYSDNTPGVTFGFDRLGRQTTITDGTGTRLFSYTDAFQLASETNAAAELVRIYDSQGRLAGCDLVMAGSTSVVSSIRYSHDELGRFRQVDADLRAASLPSPTFRYGYLAGSDLTDSVLETNTAIGATRSFEPNRNLLTQILNTSGTNRISQFDYANDAVGRRTQRVDSSSLTNNFGYNSRSELVEALMGINNFSYRYDPIGNRTVATNNGAVTEYLANSLNQYSAISNQQSQIAPAYDLDGNLTNDGRFAFAWDAENRMTGASNEAVVANYSYDYMSRRYRKIVSGVTNNFVYDGWNLIQETSSAGVTNTYVWGLDLSGTQQGAGGIGGLLSVMRNGATYYPCYDANGNISEYVDASGAVVAHREYDAYGNTVASSGQMVNDFNFWFSSKYLDQETGLYYYGFRYYSAESGRWASRDPLGEIGWWSMYSLEKFAGHPMNAVNEEVMALGDMSTYAYLENEPEARIDFLGLDSCVCPSGSKKGKQPKPPPYSPTGNGCGPENGASSLIIPNDPMITVPPFFSCPFTSACDGHDKCYGNCNSNKSQCDKDIYQGIKDACHACWSKYFKKWDPAAKVWFALCKGFAGTYYTAVSKGGASPYADAQKEACDDCCCK